MFPTGSTRRPARPGILVACLALAALASPARAGMPLNETPFWESTPNGHRATGGAWADVDGDGWIDMIVANGNDMARQHLVVYHNNGDGTFPLDPTWVSADIDYHGHLDVGDINGDGLVDVAVAVYLGPNRFGDPGCVKVYLNDGAGGFHSLPSWISADRFFCFSVALGDADGDGDLDLACACGEDYYDDPERQRIYFNNGGVLEATPSWVSTEIGYALDVFWSDVDGDGDLDLAFCGTSTPLRVYLNAQTAGGGIATTASWENADLPQYGNTCALADWNGDGFPELAVADNSQLGGLGRFKVYANTGGTLEATPAWTSNDGGYGSHVSWIDPDLDGDLDLATGRWWGAARIYENTGGTLTGNPVWSSSVAPVIENMFWGDVDNDGLVPTGLTIASGDGARTHFALGRAPARSVDEVRVDGAPVPPTAYAVHEGNGWISLAAPPPPGQGNVEIRYTWSADDDLGLTTWDSTRGNYIFLHQGVAAAPPAAEAVAAMTVAPNPMIGMTALRYRGTSVDRARVAVHDADGRLVRTLHDGPLPEGWISWQWDRRDEAGRIVASGVYFARMEAAGATASRRLVVLK